MAFIILSKIYNIIILFLLLLINTNQIINNPQLLLNNVNNPLIYGSNNLLNIFFSGIKYSHDIATKNTTKIGSFCTYTSPFMLINEQGSKTPKYIYSSDSQYLISLSDSKCDSIDLGELPHPTSSSYVDYIIEQAFSPLNSYGLDTELEEATGLRCQSFDNEIIIFGKNDTSEISFSFTEKRHALTVSYLCEIEDFISCKKVVSSVYLCAYICNSKVNIVGYAYQTLEPNSEIKCEMKNILTKEINFMGSHTQLKMFDIGELENIKLLCAKNKNTYYLDCLEIEFIFDEELDVLEERTNVKGNITKIIKTNVYNLTLSYENKITFSFNITESGNEHCVFKSSVENEYLLCCGGTNIISCARTDNDLNLINSFILYIDGVNTHINIFKYSSSINIVYMNTKNNIRKLYEYSIILPSCIEKTYTCIPMDNFNDYLKNLVIVEMNSKYYALFTDFPSDYGNLTLNNEIVDLNDTNETLITETSSFGFMSTTEESIKNAQIKYIISVEETFSSECYVNLDIQECYVSCKTCTKPAEESTSSNHNCKPNSCKDYYYLDPDVNTNCWSETEGKSNWYIDYTNKKYEYCNDLCASCTGPLDTDCLSCKADSIYKYLANKKCYTQCPDGYYGKYLSGSQYYNCEKCFQTCATCDEGGNVNNMKCKTCIENSIHYLNNCFIENDSEDKSFIIPGTTSLSSCYERFDFFILANTYECITTPPSEGYYLDNSKTGLYSPCHTDCRTCRGKPTQDNTNCILCLNEDNNYLDGNCLEFCPIGYYSLEKSDTNTQKKCVRCYSRCLSCQKGQEYNSNNKLTKMNCLQCRKDIDPNNSTKLIDKHIKIDVNCFPFVTYTEEKITFDITDIKQTSSEITIKTCLDFELSIFFGEYECITKPSNTYYILQNEENTGVIKYCNIACATCHGAPDIDIPNTNCIVCSEGYFKTEDSETNCILESLIPANYYKNLDDNIYYKCYSDCITCKRTLEHKANTNEMGCITCISNYYLLLGTNNCFNNSFLDENINYFFSAIDNKFHKCYDSCKRCSVDGIDENNQNCDECKENYYFEENTKNCFNSSYTEKGYYLDNFTINVELSELHQFKKCYANCKTCNNYLIDDDMNCISCKEEYYKIIDTNNCITDITNKGYYAKGDIAYLCEENCLTCSDGQTLIEENIVNNNNISIANISYNCLSCDQDNKNLFLVEHLNNCEPLDFKENGYYLKEESNGIKIFHLCYETCSLCEKYKEIDPITNKENHNCDECAVGFYGLLNDENPKNCYGDEMIEKGFRLVRNFWQICHENCGSCDIAPTYDEEGNLVSQNCLSCYTGHYFIYHTSNCANDTYLEKGYYFDNTDNYYKECDISCISCDKYSTADDPKCIKCNNDKGYFKAVNKPDSICYNQTTISSEYVLSPRYDENGNLYKIWSLCYETCFYCSKYGTEEDHGCSSCISKHYLIYNTSNCITNDYAINNGYYFNTIYGQFYKCDKACDNCEGGPKGGNTNCKKCNYEDNYYPIEDKTNSMCYNSETIGEGYFLNKFSEPYKWSTCYENCATCEFRGTENKMNCISCRTNLKNKFNKIKNFIFINGNCIEICLEELFLTKEGDCVSECPEGTFQFQLNWNYSCVDFCPEKYVFSKDGKKCVLPEFQSYISPTEFQSIISYDINSYVNSSRIIDLDNLKAKIFYSNDLNSISGTSNQISGIKYLENSLLALKAKNSIPDNENLIIVLIETKGKNQNNEDTNNNLINLGKDIQLLIFDKSGIKLDLSDCENEQILITKNLADLPYINLYIAKDLFNKGIDAFNESDSFFSDICYPFKTNYSSDITLLDRRTNLFQNVSFCDSGCIYNGIDYELMVVNCLCYIDSINKDNDEGNNGIVLNNNKNKFPKKISKSNFLLIKCSNLAFDTNILKKNVGFYLTLFAFVFEFTFLIIFVKNGFNSIINFMLIFDPISTANPPKLQNLLSLGETNNKKNENNKEGEIQKTILINHLLNNKKKIKKIKKEKNEIDDALVVKYSQSDYEGYDSNRKSLNENKNHNIEEEKKSNSESNSDSEKEKKTKLTRKTKRKKTDKRNNLVQAGYKIQDEKPKYKIDSNNKKYSHPIDILDALSFKKNSEKKKNVNSKHNKEDIVSNPNTEDNKDDYYDNKSKKNKTNLKKKEDIEKKSHKKKIKINKKEAEENDENYYKKTIIPYRHNKKQISIKINKQKNQKDMYIFISEEYLLMGYEEAIKNDKRTWSKIYYGFLIENHFILHTFVSESFIDIRTLKINLFCFRLDIIFLLNALFYTDNYISKTYYNSGKLDFLTSLPKALFSFLVCMLVNIIIKLFFSNKKDVYKTIKEKEENTEYSEVVKIILNKIKIKLIIFFIFQFIVNFFCLYYVTTFCSVYQNSNYYWFYGCLETLTIDTFFPFIYCLFLSSFRYLGIFYSSKCLFDLSNLLNIL